MLRCRRPADAWDHWNKNGRLLVNAPVRLLTTLVIAVLAASASAQTPAARKLQYPVARMDNTADTYFGTKVPVPYQWMEDLKSPELRRWVNAENRLTDDYLAKIPIRGWIEQHLTEMWNYAKEDAPTQLKNGMLFFRRNSGLQNQSVVYVQSSPAAAPRIVLDPNKLSADGSVALVADVPSPQGRYLAYALSEDGSDWETIHVMDVATGRVLPGVVRWVKFSGISWTRDGKGFFYARFPKPPNGSTTDHAVANQELCYHLLGTAQADDRLVYARPDMPHAFILDGDFVGGNANQEGRYFLVIVQNNAARRNELYYIDLGNPDSPKLSGGVKPLYTKNDAAFYPIGQAGDTLYLWTTLDAPNGKIVATSFRDPNPIHWRTVVPEGKGVLVSAMMADGKILANYQVIAKSRVELFNTDGELLRTLALPALGAVDEISADNDASTLYYAFTSYLYPTAIYKFDIANGKTTVFFKPDVKFDPSPYEVKQVFYTSKDGTNVPMFIVAKKGLKLDGSHPTVLYGYGGFDFSTTPNFDPMLPVWLELGGVYAVANIRGGGEYGEAWHRTGMLGNKQNVFDDFAWAAKYLIEQGYTASKHLGIQGYSNGGLLTGASITQHSDLFGAAYIGHGVLDMLRYQKFSGGAYWAAEYGTSGVKKDLGWLVKYSPLQNVHAGTCYPPTFITTSWDDDRVVPSHEFKFTAKIQQAQGCDNPILLHTTGSTSHMYMPTDKLIQQDADVWAFEASNLGLTSAHGKQ